MKTECRENSNQGSMLTTTIMNVPLMALSNQIKWFFFMVFFTLFAVVFAKPAEADTQWQDVSADMDVSYLSPLRNRRSPNVTFRLVLTNNGSEALEAPARLVIKNLTPSTVSIQGDGVNDLGEPVINLDSYLGSGLTPGASLPTVSFVIAGAGRTRFNFNVAVERQVTVPTEPLSVHITSPESLVTLGASPVVVEGSINSATALLTVNGASVAHSGGTFSANVVLREGLNTVVARAVEGAEDVSDSISISFDTTPPILTIESHADGETVYTDTVTITGLINDIVRGTVEQTQANVSVNGVAASISNRSYAAVNLPLVEGANLITVSGSDQVGNSSSISITLNYVVPLGKRVELVSGQEQSATISEMLPSPLVVRVIDDALQPVNASTVVFRVEQGSGLVGAGSIDEGRAVVTSTDADGLATTSFILGDRVGVSNHKVSARVVGYDSEVIFNASATGKIGNKISVNSGNNQRGSVGRVLPEPFVVVVTDDGANVVQGSRVRFEVTKGGGNFAGATSFETQTDSDGRANAELVLGDQVGLDVQRVSVTLIDAPAGETITAGFTATAFVPADPSLTRVSGIVLDNQDIPLPGVTIRVEGSTRQAVSDEQGQFTILQAPVGSLHLIADGSTTTLPGEYPTLSLNLMTIAGVDNPLSAPIYMVKLDTENGVYAGPEDVVLELDKFPGFKLSIAKGSVTFPDGSKEGIVSVTPVNASKVPMAPPNGMQPQFIVTIQPTGTRFDPPAPLTLPNIDGHAPGAQVEMYSFDHDLEEFVAIGLGTVSEDGSLVESNSGVGVIKAGWHCGSQPSGQACAHNCPICQDCDGDCNCQPAGGDPRLATQEVPGDCKSPQCENGSVVQKPDDSDLPENASGCSACENGSLTTSDDGTGCDDGKYCTSADGMHPGADECKDGSCQGKAIGRVDKNGIQQEYDFTKIKQLMDGATLAAKFVPGCKAEASPVVKGAFEMKFAEECCESQQKIVDATGFSGTVELVSPRVECKLPVFSYGVATLTANLGASVSGKVTASGYQSSCTENCSWEVGGSVGVNLSGAIGVNVISPDVLEVQGGIKGSGSVSIKDACGEVSAQGCVGPPTAFGSVTLGGWINKEISHTFTDYVACYP